MALYTVISLSVAFITLCTVIVVKAPVISHGPSLKSDVIVNKKGFLVFGLFIILFVLYKFTFVETAYAEDNLNNIKEMLEY
jgi:hypothetical protein